MNWRTKARVQRVLSRMPGGHHANWVLQRHITRGYPRRGAVLDEIVVAARRHTEVAAAATGRPLDELRFFEFGAGWDLAGPLVLAALGARTQLLVDIRPLVRPWLVLDMRDELARRGLPVPGPDRDADGPGHTELLAGLGIAYRAPADARATGLAAGSVDVVTSTNTLEHVPEDDIRRIMAELRRILHADGVCSFAVDYHDHYADSDPSIHDLHFLRFDDDQWRRWNCDFQFQNRLRHPDYVRIFEDAGFSVEVAEVRHATLPEGFEVAARFREMPLGSVTATYGWFVLRPCAPAGVAEHLEPSG